jgi:uncharacterized membrane protein
MTQADHGQNPIDGPGDGGTHLERIVNFSDAVVAIAITLLWMIWSYATYNRRLVDPDLETRVIAYNNYRTIFPIAVFLISLGIAFVNPTLAMFSWFLAALVRPILHHGFRMQLRSSAPRAAKRKHTAHR